MTEQNQKDKKFNLEDWVTNRAANQVSLERDDISAPRTRAMMAEMMNETQSETKESVTQVAAQTGQTIPQTSPHTIPHTIQGVISMTANAGMASTVLRNGNNNGAYNASTNGAGDSVSASASAAAVQTQRSIPSPEPLKFTSALGTASQQIQIVRLLQDLGDRLRASEKEREILWREIEQGRKQLGEIDDKTSKAEKAYLSLENKLSAQPDHKADIDTQKQTIDSLLAEQKKLLEKLERVETTAGSTVVRVEDALTENHKLAKRLDQVAQDKIRLQRKLDIMEETLTQTQDSLKAKALVLLTDHALAYRTALPQTPAFTEQDKERLSFLSQNQKDDSVEIVSNASQKSTSMPWWKQQGEAKMNAQSHLWRTAAIIGLIVLGGAVGYGVSKITAAPSSIEDVEPQAGDEPRSQEQIMADIAEMANQIEPAGTDSAADIVIPPSSLMIAPETLNKIRGAEDQAAQNFKTQAASYKLSAIKPDASLSGTAKELESKALNGDSKAQHDLAALYAAGQSGASNDYERAAIWFTAAAYNGIGNAQYNLGVLKQQGLGTAQDTKGAIDLYRIAAKQNHPEAQYNLGIASIEGIGAEYDPQVSAYYFERAAAGGIVEAAYNLGLIQENGLLGDSQPDEAVFWYKLGADHGHTESQNALTQLKNSLAMNDADVTRIFERMHEARPNALGTKTKATTKSESAAANTPKANEQNFINKMKELF